MTDLTPWNNPRSYAPDCFDQLAIVEHYEKLARKAHRKAELQKIVRAFCVAIAVFCIAYFGGLELIGLVK